MQWGAYLVFSSATLSNEFIPELISYILKNKGSLDINKARFVGSVTSLSFYYETWGPPVG